MRAGVHPAGYTADVYNQADELVASLVVILPDWDSREANYVVASAENNGPPGLGPFLYEKALDWATSLGGTIESDSSVSSSARGVWQKYYERAQKNELRALPVQNKSVYWNRIRRTNQEAPSQEPPGLVRTPDGLQRYTPDQHPELYHRYRKGERLPELPEGLTVDVRKKWEDSEYNLEAYEFRLNDEKGYTQATIDVSLGNEEGKSIAQVDWAHTHPSARGKGYGRMLYNYILKWVAERGAWLAPGSAVSHDAAKAWRAIQRDPGVSREPHPSADPAMNNPEEGLDEDWTKTRAPQLFYRYRKDAEDAEEQP
jgi:GNAT superfamily N-acetyltransferase